MESKTRMRILILASLALLMTAPAALYSQNKAPKEVQKVLEETNEYGGRTIEYTYPGGTDYYFGSSDLVPYKEGFAYKKLKGSILTKKILYKDTLGRELKLEFFHQPGCPAYTDFGRDHIIIYRTKDFMFNDTDYCFDHSQTFYSKKFAQETGLAYRFVQGNWGKEYFDKTKPVNPEFLEKYGFETDKWSSFTFEYTPEWEAKTGYKKSIMILWDGHRATKINVYSDAFMKKTGILFSRDFLVQTKPTAEESKDYTGIYAFSGKLVSTAGNEFGGVTEVQTFEKNDPFYTFRKIKRWETLYDAKGVMRKSVIEGDSFHDHALNEKLYPDGRLNKPNMIGGGGINKVIDNFGVSGLIESEEIFINEEENRFALKYCKKTFRADGSLQVEYSFSDQQLKKNGYGVKKGWSILVVRIIYDTYGNIIEQEVRDTSDPSAYDTIVGTIDISKRPPMKGPFKAKDMMKYDDNWKNVPWREDYYLAGKKVKSSSINPSYFNPNCLIDMSFAAKHIPLACRLSLMNVARYIKLFAKTDLEKAYAVYSYLDWHMRYDLKSGGGKNILLMRGMCWDYTVLFSSLSHKLGLDFGNVTGMVTFSTQVHHWNKIKLEGKFYPLDVTAHKFITDPEVMLKDYWPDSPKDQCVPVPYKNREELYRKKGWKK